MKPSAASSPIDARLSVVMAALEPALSLSRVLSLSLDDLAELTATGYFSLLSKRGLSWEGIARRLRKSRRTVATLAKRSGSTEPLLGGSQRMQWRRRVVRHLADEPRSFDALAELFADADAAELRAELEQLVDEGIVERDGDTLRVAAQLLDLLGPGFDQRVESLRHFLEAVTHVIYRRFLTSEEDPEAFARVLTFSARREDLAELRAVYDTLEERVFAIDAAAEGDPEAVQASVAMCVVETPTDVMWKVRPRG